MVKCLVPKFFAGAKKNEEKSIIIIKCVLRENIIQTNELHATRFDKRYFRDTTVMMPFENFIPQTF